MRTLAIGLGLFRGRLRTDRGGMLAVALLVLLTAFVFGAVPILFERAASAGLGHAISTARQEQRDLEFSRIGRIEADASGGTARIADEERALEEGMPASLRSLVGERHHRFEGIEYLVIDAPVSVSRLRLGYRSGVDEQVRFTNGRPPTGRVQPVELPDRPLSNGQPRVVRAYEVAISRGTADQLRWRVGHRLLLAPDPEDPLAALHGSSNLGYAMAVVVGIFELVDPLAEYWRVDATLVRPLVERVTQELSIYHATALVAPTTYGALVDAPTPFHFRYTWRFLLDPVTVAAGSLETVRADLTRLQARHPFQPGTVPSEVAGLRTGLASIFETYRGQRRASEAVVSIAAMGPAAAALGATALIVLLRLRRRRAHLVLVQGRGGSTTQVLVAELLEAIVSSVPAAALGVLAAAVLLGGSGEARATSIAAALTVGVGAVLLQVLAAVPLAHAPLGAGEREVAAGSTQRRRRLVLDTVLVLVALAGLASLQGRGLLGPSAAASAAGDPFLAAVPVLVGLAVAVLALRLYPLPIRLLARLASAARGLVPALAWRNAARESPVSHLPLVVLLLATAMGVFSSALLVTVERAQEAAVWQEVGADFRSDGIVGDPLVERLAAVPGVEAVAAAHVRSMRVTAPGIRRLEVRLAAVEPRDYGAVVRDTPADPSFPASFLASWERGVTGRQGAPVPAILVGEIARRPSLRVGTTFEGSLAGVTAIFVVADTRDAFPGVDASSALVAPRGAVAAAVPGADLSPTVAYVRAPASAEGPLRAATESIPTRPSFASRPARYAALHDAPLTAAVTAGFALALVVALAYSALALGAGLALALGARRRQLALLRTLGLRGGDVARLVLLEVVPMILVAVATGVTVGLGLAALLLPSLGLGAFAGVASALPMQVDALHLLALGVAPAAVVGVGVVVAAWSVQRANLAGAVRFADP